jgi:hypothetical protein
MKSLILILSLVSHSMKKILLTKNYFHVYHSKLKKKYSY